MSKETWYQVCYEHMPLRVYNVKAETSVKARYKFIKYLRGPYTLTRARLGRNTLAIEDLK